MSALLNTKPPAPGWYRDPFGSRSLRYYDGAFWSQEAESVPNMRVASRWVTNGIILACVLAALYFAWALVFSNWYGDVQQSAVQAQLATKAPVVQQVPDTKTAAPLAAHPAVPAIPATGTPVGTLVIPKLGVSYAFTSGTGQDQLAVGPGLWQAGVYPGTPGNATISGHRTTHGAYFRHIDELTPGDLIIIKIPGLPDAVFQVRGTETVLPSDTAVTNQTSGVRLTLTTCTPPYSSAYRLVVQAEEISGAWSDKALPANQWHFQG